MNIDIEDLLGGCVDNLGLDVCIHYGCVALRR